MTWKKTSCCLCFTNCGLEVNVENNTIIKVRPDTPLKKQVNDFVPISWDQAISEIAQKLKAIISQHGPRAYAYMGGGGQGCHMEGTLGVPFMRALGFSARRSRHVGLQWTGL